MIRVLALSAMIAMALGQSGLPDGSGSGMPPTSMPTAMVEPKITTMDGNVVIEIGEENDVVLGAHSVNDMANGLVAAAMQLDDLSQDVDVRLSTLQGEIAVAQQQLQDEGHLNLTNLESSLISTIGGVQSTIASTAACAASGQLLGADGSCVQAQIRCRSTLPRPANAQGGYTYFAGDGRAEPMNSGSEQATAKFMGTAARWNCRAGFTPNGDGQSMCLASGRWSVSSPGCTSCASKYGTGCTACNSMHCTGCARNHVFSAAAGGCIQTCVNRGNGLDLGSRNMARSGQAFAATYYSSSWAPTRIIDGNSNSGYHSGDREWVPDWQHLTVTLTRNNLNQPITNATSIPCIKEVRLTGRCCYQNSRNRYIGIDIQDYDTGIWKPCTRYSYSNSNSNRIAKHNCNYRGKVIRMRRDRGYGDWINIMELAAYGNQ